MSTHTDDSYEPRGAGTGYEPKDARARPVIITGVSMLVLTAFGFFGATYFYEMFKTEEAVTRPETSPVYERQIPKGPRLQANPGREWTQYKRTQLEFLQQYGWVDESAGKVHVPVSAAMKRVLDSGSLPSWKKPAPSEEAAQ